jgi:hypothetical protein
MNIGMCKDYPTYNMELCWLHSKQVFSYCNYKTAFGYRTLNSSNVLEQYELIEIKITSIHGLGTLLQL